MTLEARGGPRLCSTALPCVAPSPGGTPYGEPSQTGSELL